MGFEGNFYDREAHRSVDIAKEYLYNTNGKLRYTVVNMKLSAEKLQESIGKTIEVFSEGCDPVAETHYGRSRGDASEIDVKVYFYSDRKIPEGEIIEVEITEAMDFDLMGEAVEKHMK